MQLLTLLVLAGILPGHASGARTADTGQPDPAALGFLLGCVFVIPMFVCFTLGLGHLIDWFEIRGWRPPDQRRKLK
jgi:hypothetical protein